MAAATCLVWDDMVRGASDGATVYAPCWHEFMIRVIECGNGLSGME